jgi:hypothetical protein
VDPIGWEEVITWLLSGVALIVSVVFAARQHGIQTRLAVIERERREEEVALRRRAELTATYQRRAEGSHVLLLRNYGLSPAYDVRIEYPADEKPTLYLGDPLPLPVLDANQEYAVPMWLTQSRPGTVLTLIWRDGTGPRKKTVSVSTSG